MCILLNYSASEMVNCHINCFNYRILTSIETFLDNLDLSTVNQTSDSNCTILNLRTFALQVEEFNPNTFNGQTFKIVLGPVEEARNFSNTIDQRVLVTVDGVVGSKLGKINRNSTATLQLHPTLFRSCSNSDMNISSPQVVGLRLSYSVFLTDALFLPENRTLEKVGSIVVAVRTKCQLKNEAMPSVPTQSEAMPPVPIQSETMSSIIRSSFDVSDMNSTVRRSCAVKGEWPVDGQTDGIATLLSCRVCQVSQSLPYMYCYQWEEGC